MTAGCLYRYSGEQCSIVLINYSSKTMELSGRFFIRRQMKMLMIETVHESGFDGNEYFTQSKYVFKG